MHCRQYQSGRNQCDCKEGPSPGVKREDEVHPGREPPQPRKHVPEGTRVAKIKGLPPSPSTSLPHTPFLSLSPLLSWDQFWTCPGPGMSWSYTLSPSLSPLFLGLASSGQVQAQECPGPTPFLFLSLLLSWD